MPAMDLTDYKARTPQITQVMGGSFRAFVGDELPRIGHALGVRSASGDAVFAVVRGHAGGRQVEARLLDVPDWISEGDEVFATGEPAHVSAATEGRVALEDLRVFAGPDDSHRTVPFELRAPDFAELGGTREPLELGFSAVDRLAPPARGGLNLVLDARPESDAFDHLATRCAGALEAPTAIWIASDERAADWASHHLLTGDDARRHLWGLRVSMSWAAALRDDGEDVYLCAELPALRATGETDAVEMAMGMSIGEVIDRLGSALASTDRAEVTALLRLPLADSPHGIDEIIETMDIGDADAQIYIDTEGRLDPERSNSDAAVDDEAAAEQRRLRSALGRAKGAEDKAALLGESGLEESEHRAIALRDELRESLL